MTMNPLGLLVRIKLFADEALCPAGTQHSGQGFDGGACVATPIPGVDWFTRALAVATLWYYLTTLAFELPVLWLMGFKSQKAISYAILANFITVFSFHFLTAYFNQRGGVNLNQGFHPGFIIAEIAVTVVEAGIYLITLHKELSIKRIIVASILANAFSAIMGGYIVNNLLGGFH